MTKKMNITVENDSWTLIIGSPDEIRPIYKSLRRAIRNDKLQIGPMISGDFDEEGKFVESFPIFNARRSVYGILIEEDAKMLSIIGEDVVARWMFEVMGRETSLSLL